MCKKLLFVLFVLVIAMPASAAITYVDADIPLGGNSSPATTARDGTDDLWCMRAFGNGATVYEGGGGTGGSNDTNIENCLRLLTSVSVPANPNGLGYDVFAYFWSDGSNWRIRASTTNDAGELELFCLAPVPSGDPLPTPAVASDFDSVVLVTESNRFLLQAYLGTEGVGVTTGNVTIKAYIDDDPAHTYQNYRTWYDGIGYRAVPEPATMVLLGLGGLALLRRKRS